MIRLLELLITFIGTLVRWYFYGLISYFGLILVLSIIIKYFTTPRTKSEYYIKFILLYYAAILGAFYSLPIYLLRPKNVINIRFTSWFVRKCSYIIGITFELRGVDIAKIDEGAILCGNHQSSIDVLTMVNLFQIFGKISATAKKQLLYVLPFGPCAYFAGLVYLDRKSPKKAYNKLDDCGQLVKEKRIKLLIYPEGTRNKKGGLLPFKKGAFITAIKAQVPIIPMITSPYYFLDDTEKILDKGHVIVSVMKPIPTINLTLDDVNSLLERTQKLMMDEYIKINKECEENAEKWRNEKRPRLTLVKNNSKIN